MEYSNKTVVKSPGLSPWLLVLVFAMFLWIVALIVLPPAFSCNSDVQTFIIDGDKPQTQTEARDFPMVKIRNGVIRGVFRNDVRAFHGVPFAEPPVGELRWRHPQRRKPWHPSVLDATEKKAACPQTSPISHEAKISEDCLHLEIFAPVQVQPKSGVPVLLYLHGGSYQSFSATDDAFDGTNFVKRTGVMVVVVNYRLGALGFLVFGDEKNVQGNFGLYDQAMALEWLYDNVGAFGGDPHKITLAGQSAGAQASIIHLLSKTSSKFFRSIILESPPVPVPLKTYSQGIDQTKLIAEKAGCLIGADKNIDTNCLRQADTPTILDAQKFSKSFGDNFMTRAEPWGPVMDGKMVRRSLMEGFIEGKHIPSMPILWGVTSEEAMVFVRYLYPKPTGSLLYLYAKSVLRKLGYDPRGIGKLYPLRSRDSRAVISSMATDNSFLCPMHWATQQLSLSRSHSAMWTYVFDRSLRIPSSSFYSMCSGFACHGIEIPYVFGTFPSYDVSASDVDKSVSHLVMDYYANFMRYGNPNGNRRSQIKPDESELPYWPRSYEANSTLQSLFFNKQGGVGIGGGVSKEKCQFWSQQYP